MRLCALLALLFLARVAGAGEQEVTRLAGEVEEMRLHVRSSLPVFSVGVEIDSTRSVSIDVRNLDKGDGNYPEVSLVTLSENTVSEEGVPVFNRSSAKVNHKSDEFSICVTVDAGGTLICAGDGERILDGKINLTLPKGTVIKTNPALKDTDYVQFDARYKPERKRSEFSDARALHDYLSASTDSLEGIWQWVDCETDAPAVTAGGRYTLATVADSSGGYDLVYVGGAKTGNWQPLDIKGHMSATPFINQFDVTWYDAEGRDTGEGIYATIDADGLMTLTFTPLRSRMRLIKRP